MKKKTTKRPKLSREEIELLDKLLCGLNLLVGIFTTNPQKTAKALRKKLANKRGEEKDRFPDPFVPGHHYSFGLEFLKEFDMLIKKFVRNERLGNDYDRRRMRTISTYVTYMLEHWKEESK